MKKALIGIVLILFAASIGAGIAFYEAENQTDEGAYVVPKTEVQIYPMEHIPLTYSVDTATHVSITAIGDIMMHEWQIQRCYDKNTDSFDNLEAFTYIEPYLSSSDYTIGNLETTLAGRYQGATSDALGYSGYPRFNAPEILVDNLKKVGIDMLGTANNHSMDSNINGVYATLDYLDSRSIPHVGTARNEAEQNQLCLIDVNGIKIGFCAYTYDTNGIPVPDSASYGVNTLHWYSNESIDEMCDEVHRLRDAGADLVMPMVHFGTEYQDQPDKNQYAVVDRLFEAGADIIIGGHPHVVEPMEIRTITNEDGTTRTGYVIYSLGNFISSQKYENGIMKDIGVIMDVDLVKDEEGTRVEGLHFAPTYVYWNEDVIGVVPVIEAYDNPTQYSFLSDYDRRRIADSYTKTIVTLNAIENCNYTIENYKYNIEIPN